MTTSLDHFSEELFLFRDIESEAAQDDKAMGHTYTGLFLGALAAIAVSAGGWVLILTAVVRLTR